MKIILAIFLTIILATQIQAQIVIGKIVDENQNGLSGIALQLYVNNGIDTGFINTTTLSDGSFIFNVVTDVKEGQLPTGYVVYNNFPNPFNPTTRIGITLPTKENIKIDVFNLLGQEVIKPIEQTLDAGTNFIDIELNGLANGVYNARVTIENKYTVVKKMMLVYGGRHLAISEGISNTELQKINNTVLETNIDSLVATNLIIGRKTFMSLPSVTGDTLDLGNLTIERYCPGTPTVEYEGKTYNTVQIGSQCWLKENLDVGAMINSSLTSKQTNNGILEKYCYNNDTLNCLIFGGLYERGEANNYSWTIGVQGICPDGWHIPTIDEFQTLSTTIGSDGNALKTIGQDTTSTNVSGFSALFAGTRGTSGDFYYAGTASVFWSSSWSHTYVLFISLWNNSNNISTGFDHYTTYGFSVRCLKEQ